MNRAPIADVLVLGGGPAAAAAALACQHAGLRTWLVTRATASALSPDGATDGNGPLESLHAGVEPLLSHLGVHDALAAAAVATYHAIRIGGLLQGLSPDPAETWTGTHVRRPALNAELLRRVHASGVEVVRGTVVAAEHRSGRTAGVRTREGAVLRAHWMIDATGRQEILGRLLRLERRLCSPPLTALTGVTPAGRSVGDETYPRFVPDRDGWTWFTQSVDGDVTWTQVIRRGAPAAARGMFARGVQARNVQWRVFRPLVAPGAVLAGDAGALLDPACGQGVLNALYSGIMAADCVTRSMQDERGEPWYLASYDQWVMDRFETQAALLRDLYHRLGVQILQEEKAFAALRT